MWLGLRHRASGTTAVRSLERHWGMLTAHSREGTGLLPPGRPRASSSCPALDSPPSARSSAARCWDCRLERLIQRGGMNKNPGPGSAEAPAPRSGLLPWVSQDLSCGNENSLFQEINENRIYEAAVLGCELWWETGGSKGEPEGPSPPCTFHLYANLGSVLRAQAGSCSCSRALGAFSLDADTPEVALLLIGLGPVALGAHRVRTHRADVSAAPGHPAVLL